MKQRDENLEPIYTVSQLNEAVRLMVEKNFPFVWVEGEVSNFVAPHSGHWYFSVKDQTAQVRCAMFRGKQRRLDFVPQNGSHVLIKARVSLYEARGEYQLIVDAIEERGEGKLRRAFEALQKKLAAAGLFDETHKKTLPRFPNCIGVITSQTGAAIRDILHVLKRRLPHVPVIIYPTLVQGETAAPKIVQAIEIANQRNECDVLLLARGGGSLEDLWPFNEETVAYAIYNSTLPIITGIGHEIDFTIADFVSDVRAATPSAAAEILTLNQADLLSALKKYQQQLMGHIKNKLARTKESLAWIEKHLSQQHPKRRFIERMQQLDYFELSLTQLQNNFIERLKSKLQNQMVALDTLSPLATLKRGYAIVSKNEVALRNVDQINVSDAISVRLSEGTLDCQVVKKS